jgi:hypothetical protein
MTMTVPHKYQPKYYADYGINTYGSELAGDIENCEVCGKPYTDENHVTVVELSKPNESVTKKSEDNMALFTPPHYGLINSNSLEQPSPQTVVSTITTNTVYSDEPNFKSTSLEIARPNNSQAKQELWRAIHEPPILSILIPTVTKRKEKFDALMRMLIAQQDALPDPTRVQIATLCDDGELTVGAKRNKLLDMSMGEYLCFVDDDDRVFGDYLEKILEALKTKPDVVGITIFWTDDIFKAIRLLVRSLEYNDVHWMPKTTIGGQLGCGRPAHLNPTKASIAKSERFNEKLTKGEDADWSARIVGKLKTCVPINEPIYHYNFLTQGTITQRPGARENLRPALPENHQWAMRDGKIVELDEHGEVVKKEEKGNADKTD